MPRFLLILSSLSAVFPGLTYSMEKCAAQSGASLTPVIELYTSEGCSSCPPAEKWMSSLKKAQASGQVVAQAFHVNYWDYIGWKDRFAAPIYTQRQRQISSVSGTDGIYTPQFAKNGRTFRDLSQALAPLKDSAEVSIALSQVDKGQFEAKIEPKTGFAGSWSAYFTVTEHGHSSRVNAGENKGEHLQHDFLVRQYVPLGQYSGAQVLRFSALAATPAYPQQINLVVNKTADTRVLQALSLNCTN